jgi:hypothetical protein
MRDFSVKIYKELLKSLRNQNYTFQTFSQFLEQPKDKVVILRHDVDKFPKNSFVFAKILAQHDIQGTFYFRAVKQSWNEKIITDIAGMQHEIGYHYENMDSCNGNIDKAIEDFQFNLVKFRKIVPIKTISMHGSPFSKFDNKELWKKFHYKNFNIIGEPYFDIDFSKVFYVTDTGRSWNATRFIIRDKVDSSFHLTFKSTRQIIQAADQEKLPKQIMFTFHPQRWNNNLYFWTKEMIMQNIKNPVKFFIMRRYL